MPHDLVQVVRLRLLGGWPRRARRSPGPNPKGTVTAGMRLGARDQAKGDAAGDHRGRSGRRGPIGNDLDRHDPRLSSASLTMSLSLPI